MNEDAKRDYQGYCERKYCQCLTRLRANGSYFNVLKPSHQQALFLTNYLLSALNFSIFQFFISSKNSLFSDVCEMDFRDLSLFSAGYRLSRLGTPYSGTTTETPQQTVLGGGTGVRIYLDGTYMTDNNQYRTHIPIHASSSAVRCSINEETSNHCMNRLPGEIQENMSTLMSRKGYC